METVKSLTIAGSDSGGGAGIQADLKTFQELDVYGMSVLTAVTAQNTLGVQGVYPVLLEAVERQLKSIADDLAPQAVKTGMLFDSEVIRMVAGAIKEFDWLNIVVDPVMIAKGGSPLLQKDAVEALKTELIPLARVITPNIPEAEVITGMKIDTMDRRKEAAKTIIDLGAQSVVIKGGHENTEIARDLFFDGEQFETISAPRINTKNTHGTGCTFSAAIAAELAKGHSLCESVHTAKTFIQSAIQYELGIGSGHGPTNHWAYNRREMISVDA
ncbi:bifunctional hydroxymethylpyrimidine kinase/phosphomethylpyrimidine kinase [Bacillus salacetis]|uniref:Hydroxymethylpyrimidine/phosphomethylpyrimidine kinase n=1 Tax=Bacillus salacetis TaxID=2315464 RepID=A0A3A1R554_9BACI|nr:bifunctional hydroxymethylpyrimidine kinase/phosphomethylpyrimidine kinase [Bacillus salacetis]RIW38326.1 bifunctional hydroxymethylpyrimidine kinase/phosphomethylpyrimidine kinase [Bacillus salacetis]